MRRLERPRRLGRDPGRLARREGPGPLDDRGQVLAVDELHDDVRAGRILPEVVDRDDVRVVEGCRRLGLLPEARAEIGIPPVLRPEDLDRDVAVELVIMAAVDPGHATLPEQLDEPVSAAKGPPHLGHPLTPIRQIPSVWRYCRNSGARSGRSRASSTDALSQPIVVPAS